MAEKPKNLNLTYKETVTSLTREPSFTGSDCIDVIVLRFELENLTPLPQCAQELLFNSVMQEESKGMPACLFVLEQAPCERCMMSII